MKGRYLYSHYGEIGLAVTCNIRNSSRDGDNQAEAVKTSLKVFDDGRLVFENKDFAEVPFDGYRQVKLQELGFDYDPRKNYLIVLDNFKGDVNDAAYFPQEHQIVYETKAGQRANLLYDHQPAFPRNGNYSPIIVIAPKILLSRSLNTHVIFSLYREENDLEVLREPLVIQLFDEQGKVVLEHSERIKLNSAYVFDVKKHLKDFQLGDEVSFLTLVAKGGDAVYSIITIIENQVTGNIGVEHSLPPHYYVSGDQKRIRAEALKLTA